MANAFDCKKFTVELFEFTAAAKEKVGLLPPFLPLAQPSQMIEYLIKSQY
jgi:hypothetical protein